MKCIQVRDQLSAGLSPSTGQIEEHLTRCASCRQFALRVDLARRAMRAHQTDVEPPASFADKVVANLPSDASIALGWAAARLLPVCLLLLMVLAWLALTSSPESIASEPAAPTDDLIGWVLESSPEDS